MITKPKVQKIRIRKWLQAVPGGLPNTNTLEGLGESVAARILEETNLREGEEALLVNHREASGWCLLTTKRLIWCNQGMVNYLPWEEITLVQQPPERAAQIIREELSKDDITELEVFDASGGKRVIEIEAGEPYYIMWSAILAFSKLSRKPDPIPL